MNVIFTCGGTGGHINPAISVANLLRERMPDSKILFIGAEDGMEKNLVPRAGYQLETIRISNFQRKLTPAGIWHNVTTACHMAGSMQKAKKIIRAFQPAGDSFGDNFLFAGAQIGPRAEAGSWQPPQDGKPLLYTSLGSLFNNWPEFYQMLFPVVRELDLHVLCALGKALTPQDLSDIPANVTLLPFAPQLDVLAHADYFITHAGTGSAMEALYYGVPCVCIPQMDEQILTARQMVRLGVASTSMVRAEVTEDSLRDALLRLMREPHYRERARAMSRQMRETGGSACAANAIIDFIKAKT